MCVKTKAKKENYATELALFEGSDAPDKVLSYVKCYSLCEEAQVKMFELPNIRELITAYIKHHRLCYMAELKMIKHPDAVSLVKDYMEEFSLHEKTQLEMFDLPIIRDLLQIYIDNVISVSDEAEVKLVNMSDNLELFSKYVDNWPLEKPGKEALLKRENGKEHILYYINNYSFDKDEFFMMMEHPDADELVKAYRYKCDEWIKEFNKQKKKS